MKKRSYQIKDILNESEISLPSDYNLSDLAGRVFNAVLPMDQAHENAVTFFHNDKYKHQLSETLAGACLICPENQSFLPDNVIPLLTSSPLRSLAKVLKTFYPTVGQKEYTGIHPTAIVHSSAKLGKNVHLAPYAVIHEGAVIGDDCWIGSHVVIKAGVQMGNRCLLEEGAVVEHAILGDHVRLYTGVRIGQSGFGFHMDKNGVIDIPHIGRVIIESQVEIGANTTIDRGSLSDTVIGAETRIDNLVQIGHNVQIGKGCIIVAQVGIAGSTKIGDYTVLGGQAGVSGHLKVGDGVQIAAQSGVIKDISDGQVMGGSPAVPIKDWHRQNIFLARMTRKHIKKLDRNCND